MAAQRSLTMVGRDSELVEASAVLAEATRSAQTGAGQRVVLLAGDAGVGKTRLLRALRDHALAEGWQVLAGHCLDFGDSALPYLPFSEVLGRFGADRPDLVDAVAAEHPALARLQPGRRLRAVPDETAGGDLAHASGRGGTFDAVHALLDTAAADEPVLLVVEDLHWADQSTREMLGFLFTRAFSRPVAIVASYRSDDLHRRHPLRRQVAEWSRLPQVARLSLAPLPEDAVRALVHELEPGGVGDRSLARIVERAEGNAFFVEELVASEQCADGDVPGDLADLLLVRLDRLGESAREVVRVASVAGRRVSHDLLAATVTLPTAEFEAGVRQAVEMNVLEAGGERYSFRHALLGEAVYDDLLPGERVRLHGGYVAALTGSGLGTAAELARHARRANDLDRAVVASIEAGDEAMAVGGPDEASHHYQQALELLEDPARAERLGLEVSKLVVKTSTALVTSGDTLRASQLLARQLERLPADAPATSRARLLSERAEVLCIIETDLDPVAISAQALALAPEGESPLRARILATHARVLGLFGHADEAEGLATEALALAERLSLSLLVSEVVTTLSGLRVKEVEGSEQEMLRAALEQAVAAAAGAGAMQAEVRGRFLLGRSHQDDADWEPAMRWFASAVEAGERYGVPWAPYIIESRWQLAWIHYVRGDWDAAVALVDAVDRGAAPVIPRGILAPARLTILGARGEDVLDRLRPLRALWQDEGGIAVFSAGAELEVLASRGDATAAVAVYDEASDVLGRIWRTTFPARVRLAAQALAAIAQAVPHASAAERAPLLAEAERLRAEGDAVIAWFREHGDPWGPEGQMWAARLESEHLRVQWLAGVDAGSREELLEAWARTVERVLALGHVPEEARVRAAYAQILRLVGETARAGEQADAARAIAERLGAPAMLGDQAGDVQGRPAAQGRRVGHTAAPAALTPRELEILALVAEGRSNGEIGKQLFISTKTVSVHVSNILGKLAASSRTEAAAIARRDGLLA